MNLSHSKEGGTEREQPASRKDTEGEVFQNNITCEPKFVDDLTLFMAWHNWYLFQQNYVLSNLLHLQHQNMSILLDGRAHRFTATTSDNIQRHGNLQRQRST